MRADRTCTTSRVPPCPQDASGGRSAEAGYSLIEVLAAAAILAGVLISILSMFVYGGHQVNAGKMMTRATSVSGDVLEEFRNLGFVQTYQILDDTSNPAQNNTYTWHSDAPTWPSSQEYVDMLEEWKDLVEGDPDDNDPPGLPEGSMTITVRGLANMNATPGLQNFATARILQVVVTVRWQERDRARSVVFETIRG